MRWLVKVNGYDFFSAASQEDAEQVRSGINTGNRWQARVDIEYTAGAPEETPAHEVRFMWHTIFQKGYGAWYCEVYVDRGFRDEQVIRRNTDHKEAIVVAATALDAVAKSKLLIHIG